jgi:DNA-binding response OmpR family regulator
MDERPIGTVWRPDDAEGEQATRPPEGADKEQTVRVLIAHESSKAREALTDVVTRGADEYLDIITESDGADTLDLLLQEDPPEVALVDWDLPGIEGPEMCRLVRDFHHGHDTHLVILAASTHADTADAWRAGAADCVSTPASAEDLWAAVERGLRAMRARQALPAGWAAERDDWGPGDQDDGRVTLDALRAEEGATDYFGFGAVELSATLEHDTGTSLRAEHFEGREARKPQRGVLLQAVIGEL